MDVFVFLEANEARLHLTVSSTVSLFRDRTDRWKAVDQITSCIVSINTLCIYTSILIGTNLCKEYINTANICHI